MTQKELLKGIRRIWCRHNEYIREVKVNVKGKYKNTKKGYKYRYDIWEERYCPICGKLLEKSKVRSELSEMQVRLFLEQHY